MAKYIKLLFYILAVILVVNVVQAATRHQIGELEQEANIVPTSIETIRDKQRQLACLTQNVYWEAASEPAEGKIAVAQVVMNRVKSGLFGDTPCQVVFQKSIVYEKVICQFSWACDRTLTRKPVRQDLWRESQEAAKMVLFEGFRLPNIEGALYFHADYIKPNWNRKQKAQIGRHIFY
jgi:spore germination cell wall hydrolase CwlJ-like protein